MELIRIGCFNILVLSPMRYLYLLLSSLVFAFCSDCPEVTDFNNESKLSSEYDRNSSFNRLPPDIIRNIATFMEPKEIANWRTVNGLTRFSIPLKKAVELIFNISGLDGIVDDEPELAGVMALAHISHDRVLFFTALLEDVVCEKKPYEVLFSLLMLYIIRTFRTLDPDEKQKYEQLISRKFYTSVEKYFTEICVLKGLFDLVFEIVRGDAGRVGEALCDASKSGHTPMVELLLQRCDDISADYIGWALCDAAKGGDTLLVENFLLHRTDISADKAGWALRKATEGGHTLMVELFLQRFTEIPANHIGWALHKAVEGGHASMVEHLLQRCDDISTQYVGRALFEAAKGGHTLMVERFLQSFTGIPAKHVELALHTAVGGGHFSIVEIILQRRADVSAEYHL
jgi:hypothetical protein